MQMVVRGSRGTPPRGVHEPHGAAAREHNHAPSAHSTFHAGSVCAAVREVAAVAVPAVSEGRRKIYKIGTTVRGLCSCKGGRTIRQKNNATAS